MLLGKIIDGYKITKFLGKGGMASVYLAEGANKNPKKVAVKVLDLDAFDNKDYLLRFKKEAFICSKISHPNIVKVYSYGIFNSRYYLIMEFVDGKDLSFYIKNNKNKSLKEIIKLAQQIALALSFAHKNNVIHRDIKPQNILLDKNGRIKVTDFGIAKINFPKIIKAENEIVAGTAYYMSPEQIRGDLIDLRTDIYSFGILLYEMIAGKNPYAYDTPLAIINGHLYGTPPPLKDYKKDIPDYVINIVNKCIAKNKEERFKFADEIINALKTKKINYLINNPKAIILIEQNNKLFQLINIETYIGRSEINHIVLQDPHVSRRHAKIIISNGEYIIEDLNSTNGTYVNGKKISKYYLSNGDKIRIGNNTLKVNFN